MPKASPQLPVGKADVDSIVQLLRTTQEKLIHGLTHSRLDVNYTGEQGMTLLHYAAMVWICTIILLLDVLTTRLVQQALLCTYLFGVSTHVGLRVRLSERTNRLWSQHQCSECIWPISFRSSQDEPQWWESNHIKIAMLCFTATRMRYVNLSHNPSRFALHYECYYTCANDRQWEGSSAGVYWGKEWFWPTTAPAASAAPTTSECRYYMFITCCLIDRQNMIMKNTYVSCYC